MRGGKGCLIGIRRRLGECAALRPAAPGNPGHARRRGACRGLQRTAAVRQWWCAKTRNQITLAAAACSAARTLIGALPAQASPRRNVLTIPWQALSSRFRCKA